MNTTERFRDRQLYNALKRMFPPPPYLLEREVRPWLLGEARRYVEDHNDFQSLFLRRSHIPKAEKLDWQNIDRAM